MFIEIESDKIIVMKSIEHKTEKVVELSTGDRLLRAFGPLGGGILLDVADLATFGSMGLYIGPIVGGLMGWWLSSVYKLSVAGQCGLIFIGALYCALPLTSLAPVATAVLALIRFAEGKKVVD